MSTTYNETQTDRNGFPAETCDKCLGEGILSAFRGVEGGKCFKCEGQGVVLTARMHKAFTAWRAAMDAAQAGTVADLEEGVKFVHGNRWWTVGEVKADARGGVLVTTAEKVNSGYGPMGQKLGFLPGQAVRIHREGTVLPKKEDYIAAA